MSTRTDDKCTIPISTSLTSPVQSIITIISWLTHLGSVKQSIYTNFIYFSERRKDESTSSCSPAVLELTIVFLLRGIYSYFLNSRGILSTWNDKTKTLILSWTYMFLNSSNLRSVPVYKKTNIFLSMSFKKSCTFICNYKKKYTLVEKGMLLPHWTSANMASSSRSNSSGGEAASAIMKFTY